MTVHPGSWLAAETGVVIVEEPEGLAAIRRPDVAAAIWHRQPLRAFQRWIDTLDPALLPSARLILRPADVRDAVTQLCDGAGMPDCASRVRLIDDVAALADLFGHVMRAPYLRLRLDVVTGNACRKFHVDSVTARLVCTYRGQGTQYGVSHDGSDPARVVTVATGSPMLLRGTAWPGTAPAGLVHRSPPIEGTGETRLLLVLDPVHEPEDEA